MLALICARRIPHTHPIFMASAANSVNARIPSAPRGIMALVKKKTAELSSMWKRGKGVITWADFRVFTPNPTLQRPARLEQLVPDAFKALGSVVGFWAPHMFWRWVRISCPRCGRDDSVEAQGWSKIRRVMGLVPHYLVGYRYRCIKCPGAVMVEAGVRHRGALARTHATAIIDGTAVAPQGPLTNSPLHTPTLRACSRRHTGVRRGGRRRCGHG
jgi:hypothetical protein